VKNNGFFTKTSPGCLLCLLIVIAGWDINNSYANQVSPTEKSLLEESYRSFQEPIEYVLGKIKDHDLIMIGERHWVREEPTFIQNLIKRCHEKNAIDVVFFEFGNFEDQGKIDAFMESPKYNPQLFIDVLRNYGILGWGYQEYFDIFKLIYDENQQKASIRKDKTCFS